MVGSEVTFFVANEHVEFVDGKKNSFETTVTDTVFTGWFWGDAVPLDGLREFRCLHPAGDSLQREGSTISIGADPANAISCSGT